MEQDLVVNEIFGPTVQGEGRSLGRRCAFLRLGGCNLSCSWCDTPYTWDWTGAGESGVAHDPRKELHRRPVEEVVAELLGFDTELIVISGGEPLGQQERLIPLVAALTARGKEIEIETNGTHAAHPELIAMRRQVQRLAEAVALGRPSAAQDRPCRTRQSFGTAGKHVQVRLPEHPRSR